MKWIISRMRKEFPLEDQTRIDKDDEMFGRGGTFDFGNRQRRWFADADTGDRNK